MKRALEEDYPGQSEGLPPPYIVPYKPYPDPKERAARLEKRVEEKAEAYWDKFYLRHEAKFFKDRHWLLREYPELLAVEKGGKGFSKLLEIGCGVGNTILPLLDQCPHLSFIATDLAPSAINVLKTHEKFDAKRIEAFPLDIVKEEIPSNVTEIDAVMLIFVLSAIGPQNHVSVMNKINKALKTGGYVFFRDYGAGDLAGKRFAHRGDVGSATSQTISDRWFVRQDGTQAYFFDADEMKKLADETGFDVVECEYKEKEVKNVKKQLTMDRKWLQCKLKKR